MKRFYSIISFCVLYCFLAGLNYMISIEGQPGSFTKSCDVQKEFYFMQSQAPINPSERTDFGWKINPQQSSFATRQYNIHACSHAFKLICYFPIQNDYPRVINIIVHSNLDLPPPCSL